VVGSDACAVPLSRPDPSSGAESLKSSQTETHHGGLGTAQGKQHCPEAQIVQSKCAKTRGANDSAQQAAR